jgi:hypothetical protein
MIIDFNKYLNQKRNSDNSKTSKISIENCTHWIPTKVHEYCRDRLTIGKEYPIFQSDYEYYMLDDFQANSAWFIAEEGYYIKK